MPLRWPRRAANRDLHVTLAPGSRLGAYDVLSRIGAGGFGEVFKARDTRLDRTVALRCSRQGAPVPGRRESDHYQHDDFSWHGVAHSGHFSRVPAGELGHRSEERAPVVSQEQVRARQMMRGASG